MKSNDYDEYLDWKQKGYCNTYDEYLDICKSIADYYKQHGF